MKIRSPWLIKSLSLAGVEILRLWMRSLRMKSHFESAVVDPNLPNLPSRYIYAVWHEYLHLPIFRFPRDDVSVLISQHADGQFVAEVCKYLNIPTVRGSSTRGGIVALRKLLRDGQFRHLALTPDGPRGPRRQVQSGLIYLSSRLGLPIVPVGFGLANPWRLNSWDRFALPRPGSRAGCVAGVPISVPPEANRSVLERYRQFVQDALTHTTHCAERWAERGGNSFARFERGLTPEERQDLHKFAA